MTKTGTKEGANEAITRLFEIYVLDKYIFNRNLLYISKNNFFNFLLFIFYCFAFGVRDITLCLFIYLEEMTIADFVRS